MRFTVQYCPGAALFYFFKFPDGIRDLGDYVIGFLRFEICIWVKKPYFHKQHKKFIRKEKELLKRMESK